MKKSGSTLEALEEELVQETIDPSKLEAAARGIWEIAKKIALYCIGKIDTTLEEAAKVIGSTGTRYTICLGAL